MTTPAHGGKRERETVSDFKLKTPPAPAIVIGAGSIVSRLNRDSMYEDQNTGEKPLVFTCFARLLFHW